MNRTLRNLFAAPTPALPHGGGSLSLVNRRAVAKLLFQSCAIRQSKRRITAIMFPPPWGRVRVGAANNPRSDNWNTTTTALNHRHSVPSPVGEGQGGGSEQPAQRQIPKKNERKTPSARRPASDYKRAAIAPKHDACRMALVAIPARQKIGWLPLSPPTAAGTIHPRFRLRGSQTGYRNRRRPTRRTNRL